MKLVWIKLIPWNWQNRFTIASKKIARVTSALEQGLGLRLLRTEIDEVFHPLEKKNKQKTKTEMNLNPLRDEWLNAAEGFMYREDGIWFSRRQDLLEKLRSL